MWVPFTSRSPYRRWLREVFDDALRSEDPEELDRLQSLLSIHSGAIRTKFASDSEFAGAFSSRYWPAFQRILDDQDDDLSWGVFVSDPRVWELLQRYPDDGEALFRRYGAVAVDLLVCREFRDCREQVIAALNDANEHVIAALYNEEFRDQPLFRELLARELPGTTLAGVLNDLETVAAKTPGGVPRRLEYFRGLSDGALIAEFGPPPEGLKTWIPGYSIYYLGRKYAEGREINGMDVIIAAVEAAEVVIVIKGSKGLKLVQQGLKRNAVKRNLSSKAIDALEHATPKQLHPWVLREGHRTVRKELRETLNDKGSLEVTRFAELAFQKSGLGRETFKRLTDLDARIFMRADRRVVIDIPGMLGKEHALGRFLGLTATNAGVETGLHTKPGQAVVGTAAEQVLACRKNVSAW